MTVATLHTSLIHSYNIADIIQIEIRGKPSTIYKCHDCNSGRNNSSPKGKKTDSYPGCHKSFTSGRVLDITSVNQTVHIVECHLRKRSSLLPKISHHHNYWMKKLRRSLQVLNAAINDTDGSKGDPLIRSPISLALCYPLVPKSNHSAEPRQVTLGILSGGLRISSKQISQLLYSPIHPRSSLCHCLSHTGGTLPATPAKSPTRIVWHCPSGRLWLRPADPRPCPQHCLVLHGLPLVLVLQEMRLPKFIITWNPRDVL